MSLRKIYRYFLLFSVITGIITIIIGINILYYTEEEPIIIDYNVQFKDIHEDGADNAAIDEAIDVPIILWWTGFTQDPGTLKTCGNVKCFFTVDQHYRYHKMTKTFMFYGTDVDVLNLPLPREPDHEWAVVHEESPKNLWLFSHEEFVTLFNHTSTFKRQSDNPLTLQHLESIEWLESKDYLLSTNQKNARQEQEGLSSLIYTHSDCGTYSDRDDYVSYLMKLIPVDSYGTCLHNKDLPEHLREAVATMDHKDFYKIAAKYKFTLAFENAICDDYITEKIWRPLMLGSVPIIMGSPKVKDFLPSNMSALVVDDFETIGDLVKRIEEIDDDDVLYEKYLRWKHEGVTNQKLLEMIKSRNWAINNHPSIQNMFDSFECMVCERLHENIRLKSLGLQIKQHIAPWDHYGCPRPLKFDSNGRRYQHDGWDSEWNEARKMAKAVRHFIDRRLPYTEKELYAMAESGKFGDLI